LRQARQAVNFSRRPGWRNLVFCPWADVTTASQSVVGQKANQPFFEIASQCKHVNVGVAFSK
jgi:hypothetical protein